MIKVKKLADFDLPPPAQQKPGDAGYDLRSAINTVIDPGEQIGIPTGYAWEIPPSFCGLVRPRSGLAVKHRIDVRAGVIDSTFRGELVAVLVNEGKEPLYIFTGDRIAQMVVVHHSMMPVRVVDDLGESVRGESGFGDSGVK